MTIDLTTITTPFGLLGEDTRGEIHVAYKAGMLIELFSDVGWVHTPRPSFNKAATYRLAPGQVWPKPEPKRAVRYFHLWDDGCVSINRDKLEGRHGVVSIIARARVEVVEGRFDD